MHADLPTADDLKKLPARAIVAYAARTARRVSAELRAIVGNEIVEGALRLVDGVTTNDRITEIDQVSLIRAGEHVVAAYADAASGDKSDARYLMVFVLIEAELAAMHAIEAAIDTRDPQHQIKRVAVAAERATRTIRALQGDAANAAMEAARQDYEVLLREYGEHDEVVIGDPVHCFDDQAKKGDAAL